MLPAFNLRRFAPAMAMAVFALAPTACSPAGALEITGAWARTSPMVMDAGAAYLVISNDTGADDTLLSASVSASVAATVELHETVAASSGGMMEMRPVDSIDIAAGESVTLAPGGYHIMLIGLAEPLELGASIEITLTFQVAGEITVTAEVRDTAP